MRISVSYLFEAFLCNIHLLQSFLKFGLHIKARALQKWLKKNLAVAGFEPTPPGSRKYQLAGALDHLATD